MFKGVTFLSTRLGVPHVLSPVAQATGFANETSKGQRDVQKLKSLWRGGRSNFQGLRIWAFKNKKAGARSPNLRTFARAPLRGALAYVENLRDVYSVRPAPNVFIFLVEIFLPGAPNKAPSSSQRRRARPGGAREQKFSTSASAPRLFYF